MTLPQAIATMEGFYAKGEKPNRPQRNLNPGNLNMADWLKPYGASLETGTPSPRFARFPTADLGFSALHDLLAGPHYANLTIEEAINRYAPPDENNTVDYVAFVCNRVGCSSTDIVHDVLATGASA